MQGYLQLVETFPGGIDPEERVSAGTAIVERLKGCLSSQEVTISQYNLMPEDFREKVEEENIRVG
jgi:hypothetical protein